MSSLRFSDCLLQTIKATAIKETVKSTCYTSLDYICFDTFSLASLCICAVLAEPSFLENAISTKIKRHVLAHILVSSVCACVCVCVCGLSQDR